MAAKKPQAALGFSVHTGWAVVVAAAGPASAPKIVLRDKVELIPKASVDPTRFVFHAAALLKSLPVSKALVKKSTALANKNAARLIPALVAAVAEQGYAVTASGIIGSNRPVPTDLETILAAHPLLHAAEGELFRLAIAGACAACKAPVTEVPAGELLEEGGELLGMPAPRVKGWLVAAGEKAGKPWSKDHREALLVALLALGKKGSYPK